MKRFVILLSVLMLVLGLTSCSKNAEDNYYPSDFTAASQKTDETNSGRTDMQKIKITVGNKMFTASLYDNETARQFLNRLPMTVEMKELNSNEKYFYLGTDLPSEPSVPGRINVGDIKLYGNDCVVLFYESFTTAYSYTDIGKIENTDSFKEALGDGNINVTFELQN